MNAKQAIEKAQCILLVDSPFWGSLALNLTAEESAECDTMATDGKRLLYSSAFVGSLPMPELVAVIAHETSHCMFDDMGQIHGRNRELWNVATDYRINSILVAAGFKLPSDCLLDSQYDGMSAEAIYSKLASKPKSQQPKPCPWGGVKPGEKPDPSKPTTGKPEGPIWQVAIGQAAKAAKMRGKLPKGLEKLVGDLIAPPRSWKEVLREYVTQSLRSADDYTWKRPGRRSYGVGQYMPSMVSETLGCITVLADTSGSMSEYLDGFASEIEQISADTGASIEFACVDAQVYPMGRIEPGQSIPRDFNGFGGTDFGPGIEWADAIEDSSVTIYLTDGEGWFPRYSEKPVVWAMTGDVVAPFGKTIRLR